VSDLACLFHRWVRVADEGAGETLRFQRSDTPLPRMRRPRTVVEFGEDGGVVRRIPGPADSRIAHSGRWDSSGGARLVIRWDDDALDTIVDVVACDEQFLELKVLTGTLE
jgi:hypothetical protein